MLNTAYDLSWVANHAKALVLIGDAEPHPPRSIKEITNCFSYICSETDRGFYWRNEIERLYRNKGVKV